MSNVAPLKEYACIGVAILTWDVMSCSCGKQVVPAIIGALLTSRCSYYMWKIGRSGIPLLSVETWATTLVYEFLKIM